jgi:hypothetical protein
MASLTVVSRAVVHENTTTTFGGIMKNSQKTRLTCQINRKKQEIGLLAETVPMAGALESRRFKLPTCCLTADSTVPFYRFSCSHFIDSCILNDPYAVAKCGRTGRILLVFWLQNDH